MVVRTHFGDGVFLLQAAWMTPTAGRCFGKMSRPRLVSKYRNRWRWEFSSSTPPGLLYPSGVQSDQMSPGRAVGRHPGGPDFVGNEFAC